MTLPPALRRYSAAAMAALLASVAAAAPFDTVDTQDVHVDKVRGHSEVEANSVAAVTSTLAPGGTGHEPAYNISAAGEVHEQFFAIPDFGTIEIGVNLPSQVDWVVAVGDVTGKDNRDPESSYVFEIREVKDAAIFYLRPYFRPGQFLLQMVSNPMLATGSQHHWFVAVHAARGDDILDGRLRVIMHSDPDKAAVWQWTNHPTTYRRVLQLTRNMDSSGVCEGCYLAGVHSRNSLRTDNSDYLVVTNYPHEAATVNVRPAEK